MPEWHYGIMGYHCGGLISDTKIIKCHRENVCQKCYLTVNVVYRINVCTIVIEMCLKDSIFLNV